VSGNIKYGKMLSKERRDIWMKAREREKRERERD
jgi:hypothetical protein